MVNIKVQIQNEWLRDIVHFRYVNPVEGILKYDHLNFLSIYMNSPFEILEALIMAYMTIDSRRSSGASEVHFCVAQ